MPGYADARQVSLGFPVPDISRWNREPPGTFSAHGLLSFVLTRPVGTVQGKEDEHSAQAKSDPEVRPLDPSDQHGSCPKHRGHYCEPVQDTSGLDEHGVSPKVHASANDAFCSHERAVPRETTIDQPRHRLRHVPWTPEAEPSQLTRREPEAKPSHVCRLFHQHHPSLGAPLRSAPSRPVPLEIQSAGVRASKPLALRFRDPIIM